MEIFLKSLLMSKILDPRTPSLKNSDIFATRSKIPFFHPFCDTPNNFVEFYSEF